MPQDLIRRVLMKIDKNYLPYEYFDGLSILEDFKIFKGVTITKLPSKVGIYFLSKLKEGTEIIEHYHNSDEYFFIKKGKIIINDSVELGEGDEFQFKPFELHKIKVIEHCEMFVQLIKNERKENFRE